MTRHPDSHVSSSAQNRRDPGGNILTPLVSRGGRPRHSQVNYKAQWMREYRLLMNLAESLLTLREYE
jgi:hypothetical protein